MKLIPNWQDKSLRCHFCGTTKSVKYTVESNDNKSQEVYACNKCALIHVNNNRTKV